jgi:hypothetical protein
VVLGLATLLAASVLPATGAQAATPPTITKGLFGVSDSQPIGTSSAAWPRATVGSIRLWDAGVAWNQIERSPGVYDFARLDEIVAAARAHGARPLLVLGQTPVFYAAHPSQVGAYGRGAPSMPNPVRWKQYVEKVAHRYGASIDYQVWNEPNVSGYWRGTPGQMATLTRIASQSLSKIATKAKVVAPSFPVRLTTQRAWFAKFYAQRPGGRPVASWTDVVTVNPYPLAAGRPEASVTLLRAAKSILAARRVHKPIWNTEINYGLTGLGTNARNISRAREAAYVIRTYVLSAANRVGRVYWYSWDLHKLASVEMTYSNNASLTKAGLAFKVSQNWLIGGRVRSCTADRRGTYTCTVTYAGGVRRIYWNPTHRVVIRTVGSATQQQTATGHATRVGGSKRVAVSYSPIMIRSRH